MSQLGTLLESNARSIATTPLDCLVIGSGTAGVTAAIALADRGLRVAIIEAGPLVLTEHVGSGPFANREDIVPAIHDLVRYGTVWTSSENEAAARDGTAPHHNNAWSVVGGRTVFWGGCTPRFLDKDFADWPYDADDFRPWYERAERLIGVSGGETDGTLPAFMTHAAQDRLIARLGADDIRATDAPLAVDTHAVRDGLMSRGFDSSVSRLLRCRHFGRIEDGARLCLAAETLAVKLNVTGQQINSVTVRDQRNGELIDIAARHVILAGGCVQSVRLAMVSGLDQADSMIGHYMGDHLFRQAVFKLPEALGEKALYLFIPPTSDRPFHVQMQGMFAETWYSPLHATVWLDGNADGQFVLFYCFGVSKAEHDGHLVLRGGNPAAMQDYYVVNNRSAGDLHTLSEMSEFTTRVATALGAELVRTEEHGPGSALHEFGGLRMGRDAATSVTNADGRFWRVGNLSCVDSAIWPHQGSANSYLTITAMALRNASAIATELLRG